MESVRGDLADREFEYRHDRQGDYIPVNMIGGKISSEALPVFLQAPLFLAPTAHI
jgi:hypothetical protein